MCYGLCCFCFCIGWGLEGSRVEWIGRVGMWRWSRWVWGGFSFEARVCFSSTGFSVRDCWSFAMGRMGFWRSGDWDCFCWCFSCSLEVLLEDWLRVFEMCFSCFLSSFCNLKLGNNYKVFMLQVILCFLESKNLIFMWLLPVHLQALIFLFWLIRCARKLTCCPFWTTVALTLNSWLLLQH